MAYLCDNCQTIFYNDIEKLRGSKDDKIWCPQYGCGGFIEDIDELLLPTIKVLNEKGYLTRFCCSSHVYQDLKQFYINFKPHIVTLPKLPEPFIIEGKINNLDKLILMDGYENILLAEFEANPHYGKTLTITVDYRYFDEKDLSELYNKICELNKSIYKWALGLESYDIFIEKYKENIKNKKVDE